MNSNAPSAPLNAALPTVLLVEDNPGDVLLVRVALAEAASAKSFHCNLLNAQSLKEALSQLKDNEVSVVLLDLALPDADGFEALQTVTLIAPDAAVIVLTGNEDESIALETLHRGATDYLTKSELNASTLWRAVRYGIERKKKDAELITLSRTDPLTGLMNRTVFFERLGDVINQARRTEAMCSVMYLDLDDFKGTNDTFGHGVGDRVLVEVAECLRAVLRTSDFIARLGGDEFAVISSNLKEPENAGAIAQKILDSIGSLTIAENQMLRIRTSIGITVFPFDESGPHELLEHADTALYRTKREEPGSFCFYDADMNQTVRQRRTLKMEMQYGIANAQFLSHYQPIIDTVSHRVAAVEALARWDHPEHGLFPPGEFIPLAEETGLIDDLSKSLLVMACGMRRSWRDECFPATPIALNVSAAQFQNGEIADTILRAANSAGIAANCFEVEITESVLVHNLEDVSAQLRRLRDLGIRVAIDDFGTGYSSLAYLKGLPIDKLKVDRSFITETPDDSDSCAIIHAIVALADKLNMEVVAEGVETQSQFEFLQDSGIALMQGFFFCRPISEPDFTTWYRSRQVETSGQLAHGTG